MDNIKAVIVDFDDTLVQTSKFIYDHILRTASKMGISVESDFKEKIWEILGKNLPFEEIFNTLFGDRGEEVLEEYRKNSSKYVYEPRIEVQRYIKSFIEKKIPVYILTNRSRMIEQRLEDAGYINFEFSGIFETPEGYKKPAVGAYSEVFKEVGNEDPREVLIIGNHPDDYDSLPEEYKKSFVAFPISEHKDILFEERGEINIVEESKINFTKTENGRIR